MRLQTLLESFTDGHCVSIEKDVKDIRIDSRDVCEGDLFVCLVQDKQAAKGFIHQAFENGAIAALCYEHLRLEGKLIIWIDDVARILQPLLMKFYAIETLPVKIIGITGTNGKTTVSYLLEAIFQQAGLSCGVIGTVSHRVGKICYPAKNTTPSIADNYRYIAQMAQAGAAYCVMEVSSHALTQGRVDGLPFACGVFTNLTQDHLDYHRTQEEYFQAKKKLFDGTHRIVRAVINKDDGYGKRLCGDTQASLLSYGIDFYADCLASEIELSAEGTHFLLNCGGQKTYVETPLVGQHNVYNILAAVGVCCGEGIALDHVFEAIKNFHCVPGRLEPVICGQDFSVFVDYAHTHDALMNVLSALQQLEHKRIITVFGCGGDRDKGKRPKMAQVAEEFSDYVIVTNDNPRTEDPESIIEDIQAGFFTDQHDVVLDRAQAIKTAFDTAQKNDIVLIAGKGHEDYQIFKDQTLHFDDREVARSFLTHD